jgi:hypothetical protein
MHPAFEFLRSQPSVNKNRIAAMGVDKFEAPMKQQSKKIEIKIYDDVGHACENPNNQDGDRPADDADAGKRRVSFLAENLKKLTSVRCAPAFQPRRLAIFNFFYAV